MNIWPYDVIDLALSACAEYRATIAELTSQKEKLMEKLEQLQSKLDKPSKLGKELTN